MNPFRFTLDHRSTPELAATLGARDEVLGRFREGKLKTLRFDADVWTDGRNKNHFRFPDAELRSFAESFKGEPFLMDHSHELGKRGGTIIDSVLVERDGKKVIRQTIEAVKPWAIEGVLDGTIDRFSVGWDHEQTLCTVCSANILECPHLRNFGKTDKATGKPVEVLWTGIKGIETSTVTNAAAEGTGQILARLSAMAEVSRTNGNGNASGISPEQEEESHMKDKVLSLLGLPANTAEPEALSALEARLSQKPGFPKALCAALGVPESASETDVIVKAMSISAPGAFVPKAEHDVVVTELAGVKASEKVRGAMAAGKVTPAMQEWALGFAKSDPASFDAFVAHAPAQVPLAGVVAAPVLNTNAPDASGLTEKQKEFAALMGCDLKDFAETKAELEAAAKRPN